jgi:2-hydroxycyclohexanecarboxyl-CoA dehydrogenase
MNTVVRNAVVTGGASGIGLAIAERLIKDGCQVAALDLNLPALRGGRGGLGGSSPLGCTVFGQVADVTDRDQVDAALAAVRERLGPVTILVNAAGVDGFKRFADLTFEAWQRVIDVNLNGVFHCIQAVLPDMLETGWGRIVNISSSSTHSGQPFMAHYVAAKSAVNGLTKSLALELGPSGITVNAVPPGFVDTPMLRRAEARGRLGGRIEDHIERTPVRRVGRPEDIAAACAFLVSEEAGYITGQLIGVNGGRNT